MADVENMPDDNDPSKEEEIAAEGEVEVDDESDMLRKSALDKLEQASDDSLLSQASHWWIYDSWCPYNF